MYGSRVPLGFGSSTLPSCISTQRTFSSASVFTGGAFARGALAAVAPATSWACA